MLTRKITFQTSVLAENLTFDGFWGWVGPMSDHATELGLLKKQFLICFVSYGFEVVLGAVSDCIVQNCPLAKLLG